MTIARHLSFFLFLLVLCWTHSAAQYVPEERTVEKLTLKQSDYVRFNIGFSSPQGDYRNQNAEYLQSAEAGAGFASLLEFVTPLKPVDLIARLSYSANPVVTDFLLQQLALNYPGSTFNIRSGYYQHLSAEAGIMYQLPLENGSVYGKVLIGYARIIIPRMEINRYMAKQVEVYNWSASFTSALRYTIGIGLRRDLGNRFMIFLDLDYVVSSARFTTTPELNGALLESAEVQKQMNTLMPTFGLGMRLNR